MIKMEKFAISKRPYAVDLGSFTAIWHDPSWNCRITAVWFRRRRGTTVACIGQLWDFQREKPASAQEMLERHDDGRYGGDTSGRWDGESYWGNGTLETQHEHLAVLRPMLANYPEIPPNYSGWWRF